MSDDNFQPPKRIRSRAVSSTIAKGKEPARKWAGRFDLPDARIKITDKLFVERSIVVIEFLPSTWTVPRTPIEYSLATLKASRKVKCIDAHIRSEVCFSFMFSFLSSALHSRSGVVGWF
jgi:hypothetical protein